MCLLSFPMAFNQPFKVLEPHPLWLPSAPPGVEGLDPLYPGG
eukprot:CAMPEP_0202344042 /NCGR_PEP_ID=MMETSP1126-20121109/3901_1 /ASSEMBLY_ACC=CAM_ASM_000457 /TAXON_ID=3047 /ORGANISM="Dunaliella tertiolecta, Strain CCMP1320" /LENGTH=41 /DNA_ID= /DNA_START= /DNA_END= /DNA_ORIENTATION=